MDSTANSSNSCVRLASRASPDTMCCSSMVSKKTFIDDQTDSNYSVSSPSASYCSSEPVRSDKHSFNSKTSKNTSSSLFGSDRESNCPFLRQEDAHLPYNQGSQYDPHFNMNSNNFSSGNNSNFSSRGNPLNNPNIIHNCNVYENCPSNLPNMYRNNMDDYSYLPNGSYYSNSLNHERRATYDVSYKPSYFNNEGMTSTRNNRFLSEAILSSCDKSYEPISYDYMTSLNSTSFNHCRPRGFAVPSIPSEELLEESYPYPDDSPCYISSEDVYSPSRGNYFLNVNTSYYYPNNKNTSLKPVNNRKIVTSVSTDVNGNRTKNSILSLHNQSNTKRISRKAINRKVISGDKNQSQSQTKLLNPDDIDPNINPRVFSGKKPRKNMDYSRYKIDLKRVQSGEDTRLTLMIKNIPNSFSQDFMINTLNAIVPNEFDFFYMPVDFKTNCNLGFGYVSMISTTSVIHIYNALNNTKWAATPSTKVCEIFYARIQGRADMQHLCKDWAIMQLPDRYRPVFFEKVVEDHNGSQRTVMKRIKNVI